MRVSGVCLTGLLLSLLAGVPAMSSPKADPGALASFRSQVINVSQSARPYLVQVVRPGDPPPGETRTRRIIGSGVSLGEGYVVTSAGAVGPHARVTVMTAAGDSLHAEVVGVDRRTNVAVLKLPKHLPAAPVSQEKVLFPGDLVVAAGLGRSRGPQASFGTVIIADGPNLGLSEAEMVQVTAPIFPGITGGALLDQDGYMVGLISGRIKLDAARTSLVPAGRDVVAGYLMDGKMVTTSTAIVTLALPTGVVMDIAGQLRANGFVTRGYLGLQLALAAPKAAAAPQSRGVLVHRVVSGSPAATAGLLPGDLILDYAGAPIFNAPDLSYLVAATLPGSTVPVKFLRRGRRTLTSVHVKQAPDVVWSPEMDKLYSSSALENSRNGVAPAPR